MPKAFVKFKGTNEEQAYQSQKLESIRESSKIAALIAMSLFAAFAPLDILTATTNYLEVTLFRAFTVALFLILFVLLKTAKLRIHPYHASYIVVGCALFCITILTAMTGGHESSYYAGINLILLGASLVFPWSLRQMTAMSIFSIVMYLLVMLVEAGFHIESNHSFFNNLSFLIGAAILSMAGSEFRDRIQRLSFMRYLELEKARNDLQQEHELKDRFFANLSHELRTPLALILGPTRKMIEHQKAKMEAIPDESARSCLDHLGLIERNAKQLLKHVNDLLEVSRTDAGCAHLQYNRVNASLIVKRIASYFENVAKEQDINYRVEAPDHLTAELDAHALERILMNLLSNAFKFTPESGAIHVRLQTRSTDVLLMVSDSGPGISESKRKLVFERFYQVENPLTRNASGTGLGLSITKSLVELHKGKIHVGASILGGAEFQVEIPKQAPKSAAILPYLPTSDIEENWVEPAPISKPSSQIEPKDMIVGQDKSLPLVLMIEDNQDFGEFLKSVLSSKYRVAHAGNGAIGVEMAEKLLPDLILSDIMMPEMSGDVVLKRIKENEGLKDVPILMLTAKADDELRLRLLKMGASDYLIKPFVAEELLAKVENLISLKVSTDLLRKELLNSQGDLATLIREITNKRRLLKKRSQELEEAKESALKALRLREEFISVASHELRTPLTSMTLQTQMAKWLLENHPDSFTPRTTQLVHIFDTQVERLVSLVNGMFDFSAIRSGRLRLQAKTTNLMKIIQQTVEFINPQISGKAEISIAGPSELNGRWDPARIGQVLSNLISNAIRHGGGAPVKLCLEEWDDEAVLHISDTGPGIPPELQDKIFNRFERFTTNPAIGGLGLGLFISKTIVEAHQGSLTVASELGKGTTFTMRLPKAAANLDLHDVDESEHIPTLRAVARS